MLLLEGELLVPRNGIIASIHSETFFPCIVVLGGQRFLSHEFLCISSYYAVVFPDNVDPEEVERVERDATNVLNNVLNVFSGAPKTPKPEAKICKRSSFKKLTCMVP